MTQDRVEAGLSVLILIFYSHVNELFVAPVCVLFPMLPAGMRQRGGSWNVTIYYLHCLDLLLRPLAMTSNLSNCKGSFTGTCTIFPVAAKAVLCHHGVQALSNDLSPLCQPIHVIKH